MSTPIYLDYQATTPLAPEAREAMLPFLDEKFGNPHSPHRLGREAAAAVEVARERVMEALLPQHPPAIEDLYPSSPVEARDMLVDNVAEGLRYWGLYRPEQADAGRLFFTSGATEAANWAIRGTWWKRRQQRPRIVTIATEHACMLDTCHALEREGADIVVVPVNRAGSVDLDLLGDTIDDSTTLVAAMLVNNEIGTIHEIARIGRMARAVGATMFCDAVQGLGRTSLPLGWCDLVAVSAHKIHGPKGIGALWVRKGHEPEPIMYGGGQEGGIRSGTLSPALCSGFGAAAALCSEEEQRQADKEHVRALFKRARKAFGHEWTLNGSIKNRYSGNLNIRREGVDAARLISEVREVAFSAGSACASGSGRPSHVLSAIGLSDREARSSIRLGFGRYTTVEEIDRAVALIAAAAERQLSLAA